MKNTHTQGTPYHRTYGESLETKVSDNVHNDTVEVRESESGRTSTIRLVPNVMTSVDTPNSSDVTTVAVLKMLLEKVRTKVRMAYRTVTRYFLLLGQL